MRLRFITLESKPVLLEQYSLRRNCAQPSVWSLDSSWGGLGQSTEPCKCFCVDDMASPGKNLEPFHVLSHLCIVCKKSCGLHLSFSKLCGLSLSGQQLPHCAVADPGSQKSLKDRKCFPALCLFLGGFKCSFTVVFLSLCSLRNLLLCRADSAAGEWSLARKGIHPLHSLQGSRGSTSATLKLLTQ